MQKRESLGLPPGDTDPFFDGLDESEWQVRLPPGRSACDHAVMMADPCGWLQEPEDPPELVAAREKLASLQQPSAAALPGALCSTLLVCRLRAVHAAWTHNVCFASHVCCLQALPQWRSWTRMATLRAQRCSPAASCPSWGWQTGQLASIHKALVRLAWMQGP